MCVKISIIADEIMIAYLRTLLLNLLVCLFLGPSVGLCQDMDSGFKMLENGDFGEARSFFEKVLADFPQNKTARLCHGRAVGLSGDPERAIKTFTTLLNEYPGDTEVRLNLAESYLWQKTPTQAIPVYTSLISEDPTQFGAVLGIANSYSMNLQYYNAYQYINKALELQPDNGQAKLSAKFIRLGFANKLASQDHLYDSAFQLLEENLTIDPNDQESLALRANIYIISKDYALADATYQQMQDPITSLKGQSVALHLLEEDELALEKATEALELTKTSDEYAERSMEAGQHYVSALLWNSRLKDAGQFQDSLYRANQDPELIATQAEVAMYEGDFVKGIDRYNAYLEFKPRSFNGNLGKANAMHALGMDKSAYNMAFKSKVLFPGQLDVLNFIGNLNLVHSPRVSGEYLYGRASDESIVTGWTTNGSLSIDPLFNVSFSYGEKEFTPPTEGTVSTSETFAIDLKRQINKRLKLNTHY
ncbi:MAG: tetratricopeptide repeat protein, partial [Bacteroidota bacterium]